MTDRPTLLELAQRHAAAGFSRKTSNADLRRHGYDPDGADGRHYRAHFTRLKTAANIAATAADLSAGVQVTCLWDLPAEEWPEWIRTGCGSVSLTEYRERIAAVRRAIEDSGGTVILVSATVADVLAEIEKQGLLNDTQGRAAAIASLGTKRMENRR